MPADIPFVRLPTALMTTTKRPNPTTTTRRHTTRTTRKVITASPIRTIRTTTRKRAANLRTFSTYSNQPATITGWGITESKSIFFSDILNFPFLFIACVQSINLKVEVQYPPKKSECDLLSKSPLSILQGTVMDF